MTFVNPGLSGVRLEFVGPAGAEDMLKEWLADEFDAIIPSPPW